MPVAVALRNALTPTGKTAQPSGGGRPKKDQQTGHRAQNENLTIGQARHSSVSMSGDPDNDRVYPLALLVNPFPPVSRWDAGSSRRQVKRAWDRAR